ncbi:MaoC family dehydratase [Pseudonocardia lacus]|uniref:MaoC family dehydratase n=1 Tax=Pseudonocardia lacus TaxID=2835865 RepID=UPI0027E37C36|nr:MaoC family dehydratase [Pseudonocardia lacus]
MTLPPAPTGRADRLVVRGSAGLRAAVGAVLGPTDWLRVDQRRIDAFAEVTGDHQWIHVDPERAGASAFGSTIAHGYLTLSLCNYFLPLLLTVEDVGMGINYGANRVRFPAPLPAGSRIRGRGEITACADVHGGVQATILVTAEIEGRDRPACVVETLNRWLD